ncbi:MAG: 2-amino-4-hydroxy-6-hydroxymethyldihydropteridine diphosphokinase, partial [Deltaproteobacteria bacterium]|nr:2-amino-4-hydroxy-6-hydroxymethyldihydropteridine diphosphokinase [Deltaproteobacteria bacterium]
MDNTTYIGIGSNQGNKYENCVLAIESICSHKKNKLLKQSSLYLTEPWGYKEQDDFINAVIKIETSLSPLNLLSILQDVER